MIHHKQFQIVSASLYVALLAWIILMIYELGGSLSHSSMSWAGFFSTEPYPGRTRDWIENFLLSFPGGILAGLAFNPQKKGSSWILVWFLPLFLTATGMEVIQHWIVDRHASFWDAVLMNIGIVSGGIIGWQAKCVFRHQFDLSKLNWIFLVWMVYPCIPGELQLNEADFYQVLKLLQTTDHISLSGIIWATGCWFMVAHLAPWQNSRTLPILMMLFTLLGMMAPQRALLPELLMGGGLATIILAMNRVGHFSQLTLTFTVVMIAIGLEFAGSVTMHSQIPLLRSPLLTDLSGSRWLIFLSAAIEDYFLFLSLPWAIIGLAKDSKSALRWTISGGVLILAATLLAPLFFSTSFTITGFIIYLVNAVIAKRHKSSSLLLSPISILETSSPTKRLSFTDHPLLPLFCAMVLISLAMAVITHLPGVPYNVRELFETRNLFLGSTIFSAFLVWNVAAPGLMAYYLIKHPILHLFQPLIYLLMATVSWVFLRFAVSAESLHDILGAPVWDWPSDTELYLRFIAVAYPFLWSLFCWNLYFQLLKRHPLIVCLILWTIAIIMGMPLLFAAKFLIFDRAATDNVVELINNIPALFSLILLIAWNGVFVIHRSHLILGVLVTALSAVLSYGLLSIALYSSAISFLLSPDRETLIIGTLLLFRWILLYVLMVGFIVFGQSLIAPWLKRFQNSA